MKKGVAILFIVLALFSFMIMGSSQASLAKRSSHDVKILNHYKSLDEKISQEGSADVIIRIKDHATGTSGGMANIKALHSSRNVDANAEIKAQALTVLGKNFDKSKDLNAINGFSGRITKSGLDALKNSGLDIEVYDDGYFILDPLGKNIINDLNPELNFSVPSIGANYSWNVLNMTGQNISVAVIDTGIDYTHHDLGNCTITPYITEGTNDSYVLESDHNYNDSFDHKWNITIANYSRIALHFNNISLVYPNPGDIDSQDRIIIYDSNMREIAVYHGIPGGLHDIWTPYSDNNTIYVRLETDAANNDYGFYIDEIRNGTTNTTYNWSNCTRVIGGWDFVNNDGNPMDDVGHGTHVAGTIGANGLMKGVAPDVNLYALKVCYPTGGGQASCKFSDVIEAIGWAINHDIKIISMSIGTAYSANVWGNTGKDVISQAVDDAASKGVIVIISAGNDGSAVSTIDVPAAAADAITVGAVDDNDTTFQDDDTLVGFSSRGPSAFGRLDPDITAPGYGIVSTVLDNAYASASGTSMAAPHVAGAAALLLEKYPNITPLIARARLLESSYNITNDTGKLFDIGTGEVNIENALRYNSYALVHGLNSYGMIADNDRWEFITNDARIDYANITVYNDNPFNVTYIISMKDFQDEENNMTLSSSQVHAPLSINVANNSNTTFEMNFSLDNFSAAYASSYAGLLLLKGTGYNATGNLTAIPSINLRIPIVVTVPIINHANIIRTMKVSGVNIGDVLSYAYYNNRSSNVSMRINWSNATNDLDLYEYNSSADLDQSSGNGGTDYEFLTSTIRDDFRWLRIHSFDIPSPPMDFTINITDNENHAPTFNVTNIRNTTNLTFPILDNDTEINITIKVNHHDQDNDTVILSLNDSRYALLDQTINYSTYFLTVNHSIIGSHLISISATDNYGGITVHAANITLYNASQNNTVPETPVVTPPKKKSGGGGGGGGGMYIGPIIVTNGTGNNTGNISGNITGNNIINSSINETNASNTVDVSNTTGYQKNLNATNELHTLGLSKESNTSNASNVGRIILNSPEKSAGIVDNNPLMAGQKKGISLSSILYGTDDNMISVRNIAITIIILSIIGLIIVNLMKNRIGRKNPKAIDEKDPTRMDSKDSIRKDSVGKESIRREYLDEGRRIQKKYAARLSMMKRSGASSERQRRLKQEYDTEVARLHDEYQKRLDKKD